MNNISLGNRALAHMSTLIAICAFILFPCCSNTAKAADLEIYHNKVIFTAPSAEKIYDGTPLTEQIDVTAQGLPEGYTYKAVAEGSITFPEDNADNNNIVTDYIIFDPSGLNVTDKFVNVELRPGTLRISEKEAVLGATRKVEEDSAKKSEVLTDDSDNGESVLIEDEETAKSDKIKDKSDVSLELILYSFLVMIMLAVFVIFMMDSKKMREK